MMQFDCERYTIRDRVHHFSSPSAALGALIGAIYNGATRNAYEIAPGEAQPFNTRPDPARKSPVLGTSFPPGE